MNGSLSRPAFAPDVVLPPTFRHQHRHSLPLPSTSSRRIFTRPDIDIDNDGDEDNDNDDDDEDDEDEDNSDHVPQRINRKSRIGGPRAPGACDPCKASKVKCVFTLPRHKCRRCANGGHECRVSGRKQKPPPPSQDELLARLRQKDGVILSLLLPYSSPTATAPPLNDDTSLSSPSPTSTLPLPPIPVWDKRTPKPEVDRRVAAWIAEARRRVNGIDPVVEDVKGLVIDPPQRPPNILQDGLVTPQEVETLFRIFFDKINLFFTICDPVLHTPTRVFRSSLFLFTTICAVASRHYSPKPSLYPALLNTARRLAGPALNGPKSIETCQAYLLLGVYHPPPHKFPDDRAFLFIGLAIRLATDLELHMPQIVPRGADEETARQVLNRARVWMNCFSTDRSICTQLGKPSALGRRGGVCKVEDGSGASSGGRCDGDAGRRDGGAQEAADGAHGWVPYDLGWWWCSSVWNGPHDIHMCAYVNLLQMVSGFHEVVVGRSADGGAKQFLDLALIQSYVDKITRISDEWTQRLVQNSAVRPHRTTTWRDNLWPFLVLYAKLVVLSIGLEDAMRQGLRRSDNNPFAEQCMSAAMGVVVHVTGTLAGLGYLRYAVEAHFVFMGFAAAFLLKILRPKFAFMVPPGRAETILGQIERLIAVLGSDDVVVDRTHTPRLYARFLEGVVREERERARRRDDGGGSVGAGGGGGGADAGAGGGGSGSGSAGTGGAGMNANVGMSAGGADAGMDGSNRVGQRQGRGQGQGQGMYSFQTEPQVYPSYSAGPTYSHPHPHPHSHSQPLPQQPQAHQPYTLYYPSHTHPHAHARMHTYPQAHTQPHHHYQPQMHIEMDTAEADADADVDMMLHSMTAITDPRFWEVGTMPGWGWAVGPGTMGTADVGTGAGTGTGMGTGMGGL